MKKSLCFLAILAVALFVTGCTSVHTNDAAVTAQVCIAKEFKPDIVSQDKKVSGEASVNALFGIFVWGVNEYADDAFVATSNNSFQLCLSPFTVAKQGATYDACSKAKADYILGAKYKIDTKDYFVFKQIKCTVTGFPAELKGIK